MVTILAILGLAVYAGIRLAPIYLEYMSVARALEQMSKEGGATSPNELRQSFDRRANIDNITTISAKDLEIKRVSEGWTVRAYYRSEAPFIANVSLVADFDKMVTVGQ
jgi:hypothetical protein